MKIHKKLFSGIPINFTLFVISPKLQRIWSWNFGFAIRKIWAFIWYQKYTTSGWALGDENVIGIRSFNWSLNLKNLLHMCDTYNCDYLQHSTFRFNLINFQLNTDFFSQFCIFFFVKTPSVTQRSVSQENAFKKIKKPLPFFHRTISSNNSFTLIENNFWFFKIVWIYGNSTLDL